jgi:ribonuclease T1
MLVLAFLASPVAGARGNGNANSADPVPLQALPVQGQETYQLILRGGPFPYEKDGSVFGNRERLLPGHKRGFYREYTVRTPGERDRGARRIVCGGPATMPEVCYYTADHYDSFRRIVP